MNLVAATTEQCCAASAIIVQIWKVDNQKRLAILSSKNIAGN